MNGQEATGHVGYVEREEPSENPQARADSRVLRVSSVQRPERFELYQQYKKEISHRSAQRKNDAVHQTLQQKKGSEATEEGAQLQMHDLRSTTGAVVSRPHGGPTPEPSQGSQGSNAPNSHKTARLNEEQSQNSWEKKPPAKHQLPGMNKHPQKRIV